MLYTKETKFVPVLKKKSKSVLLPYVLWNILTLVFFYAAQSFSFTKPYFATLIIRNFTFMDYVGVFTGKTGIFTAKGHPLVFQFWFLRDLFILDLAFIGIRKTVDKVPFGTLCLLFILWISNIKTLPVSAEALLFFTLGYYVVKYSPDYKKLDRIKIYDIIGIYLVTIALELFLAEKIPVIHKINILIGSILFIKLTKNFVSNEKIFSKLVWLEKYAFFVYAIHGTALAAMTKLSARILPMRDGWLLVQYFGVSITGIVLFVLMGILVKTASPKLYAILTGGRI